MARTDVISDAATASHSASVQYESQESPEDATTLGMGEQEESGDETPESATMDDRKPDISLVDLPQCENVVPSKYLWRQCAVFMEMKKSASDGPLGMDTANALRPDGELVTSAHAMLVSKHHHPDGR